jgi:hypothetical protein
MQEQDAVGIVFNLGGLAQITHGWPPIRRVLVATRQLGKGQNRKPLVFARRMGDTGKRQWLHTVVYAAALTLTVYTIIDLEFPRAGIIRVDRYDQALVGLRNSMN